jgi:sucrose-6-phosphate hydrolase SacC (GH32 family)
MAPMAALAVLPGLPASSQTPSNPQAADYNQPYRPQVHFSPQHNWTNDPNGLVYFEGEYHLFFQYNPFGDQWGHMSWGHAVSTDLLHWHELPVAIPEKDGVMIFTGSVVVDRENSSGFCKPVTACLVAIYTGNSSTPAGGLQTQNIAYSQDRGRTWTAYPGNPVLDLHMADFRDPSVFRDEAAKRWVMAVSLPKEHKVRLYGSADLKAWKQLSEFGPAGDTDGDWECPDLLHIPAEKGGSGIWALKVGLNPGAPQGGSGEQYFLGDFDGKTFTESSEPGAHGWTNYGKDDYCAISFNGLPRGDKPVLLGWMSNWQYAGKLPTSPWRGQMSLPRRLSLLHDDAGLALSQQPITGALREDAAGVRIDRQGSGDFPVPYEVEMTFAPMGKTAAPQPFGVRLYSDEKHWTEIGFDPGKQVFYIDRTQSGAMPAAEFASRTEAPLAKGRGYDLRLVVDRSSVEAYAQKGTIAMTDLILPLSPKAVLRVFPEGALQSGKVWRLRPIWSAAGSK